MTNDELKAAIAAKHEGFPTDGLKKAELEVVLKGLNADEAAKAAEADVKALQELNEQMKQQLENATVEKKAGRPVITIDKVKYMVLGGVKHDQKIYSAEQLAKEPKICEELLEKGSHLIVELKAKED